MSDDHELAARLARRAGERLVELREESAAEPRALGDAGDAAAHQLLVEALAQERPADPVLSEHGAAMVAAFLALASSTPSARRPPGTSAVCGWTAAARASGPATAP